MTVKGRPLWPWAAVSAAIHGLALFYVWQAYIHPEMPGQVAVVQVDLIASHRDPLQESEGVNGGARNHSRALQEDHIPKIEVKNELPLVFPKPSNPSGESSAGRHPTVIKEHARLDSNRKPAIRREAPEPTSVQMVSAPSSSIIQRTSSANTAAGGTDQERNLEILRRHLEAHKFYPASARRRGIEGDVKVGFGLDKRGRAGEISILAGSGHAVLDQAALQTVVQAQPFPVHGGVYSFRLRFRRL